MTTPDASELEQCTYCGEPEKAPVHLDVDKIAREIVDCLDQSYLLWHNVERRDAAIEVIAKELRRQLEGK